MGISADDFWESSRNGKAMVLMIVGLEKVELVKEICDYLLVQHGKDVTAGAVQQGATLEQAKILGNDARDRLQPLVDSMTVSSAHENAERVIDTVFRRHHKAGAAAYAQTMAQFADLLRKRVKD